LKELAPQNFTGSLITLDITADFILKAKSALSMLEVSSTRLVFNDSTTSWLLKSRIEKNLPPYLQNLKQFRYVLSPNKHESQFAVIINVLWRNKHSLEKLHICEDFRLLEAVVKIGLKSFTKVKHLKMKNIEWKSQADNGVIEEFCNQLKEIKMLQRVTIYKMLIENPEQNVGLVQAVNTL